MSDSKSPSTSRNADTKRVAPQELSERSFKRHKTAKACVTCRQQKTRCEYAAISSGELLRCSRCIRFNVECSFQQEPPPLIFPPASNPPQPQDSVTTISHHTSVISGETSKANGSFHSHPDSQISDTSPVPSNNKHRTSTTSPPADLPRRGKVSDYPIAPLSPSRAAEHLQINGAPPSPAMRKLAFSSEESASISPVAFVWELINSVKPKSNSKQPPQDDLVSMGIVSQEDGAILSRIWNHRYDPWILGDDLPGEDCSTSAFLQAAQWTLASRHLIDLPSSSPSDPNTAPQPHYEPLRRRLQEILRRRLVRAMLIQDVSLTALRALGILALWPSVFEMEFERGEDAPSPDGGDSGLVTEPELLNTVMLKIANLMHLEQDVYKAAEFGGLEALKTPEETKVLQRARMAFRITAGNVMLHISKGRVCTPLVPLELAEKVFGSPGVLSNMTGRGNDARLVFHCNVLVVMLKMADLTSIDERYLARGVTEWMDDITTEYQVIDRLHQTLSSATALAGSNEYIAMSTLSFQLHFLRIVMFFRTFRTLHRAFPQHLQHVVANDDRDASKPAPSLHKYDMGKAVDPPHGSDPNASESQYPPPFRRLLHTSPHLGAHPTIGPFVRETGSKMWVCVEALMAATIALGRKQDDANVPGEGVVSPIGCAPDYVSYTMLLGPTISFVLHIATIAHSGSQYRGADMVKSLLDRIYRLFKDSGKATSSSSEKACIPSSALEGRLINPMAIRCSDVVQMLIKMWDAQTAERLARPSKEKTSMLIPGTSASSDSSYPTPTSLQYAQQLSHSGPTSDTADSQPSNGSQIPVSSLPPSNSAPSLLYSDSLPSHDPSFPSYTGSLDFGDLSQILGINLDFDLTPLYDSSIFNGSLTDGAGPWSGGFGT